MPKPRRPDLRSRCLRRQHRLRRSEPGPEGAGTPRLRAGWAPEGPKARGSEGSETLALGRVHSRDIPPQCPQAARFPPNNHKPMLLVKKKICGQ